MRSWKVLILVPAFFLLGACTQVQTRYPDAEEGKNKDPAVVNTQLGIEYMRKGMNEAALEKFKRAIRQNPELQKAHTSIAILYEQLGKSDLADKHYRKAYNLDRDDPVTLNNYGQYLCRSGHLKEADEMFQKALQDPLYRYPEVVFTNAGICAQKQADVELAEKYFRGALNKDAKYQPALRQMVRSSFAQNKYLATRAYLQRLQQASPLTPEFLWIGVRAEAALGDKDAQASYALVLKNRYPDSEQTQALVVWERRQRER